MKKTLIAAVASVSLLSAGSAFARQVTVEVTNLTNAVYFTPLLIAAHGAATRLFQLGEEASAHLQAMAEGGDIAGLAADVMDAGGRVVEDPAGGLLAPGHTASASLSVRSLRTGRLSLVGMLLPTNDGFVGADSVRIPVIRGTYTYFLNGYDAGTETNDEQITGGGAPGVPGIPADPGGNAGTGGSGIDAPDHNTSVHIHRGIVGDDDPMGGKSDLDSATHRFQNPVARLVITVGGAW